MNQEGNVVKFRDVSLRDIPGMLRKTADAIETGEYKPESAVLILSGDGSHPHIFSFGDGQAERAIFLMEMAKAFLLNNMTSRA